MSSPNFSVRETLQLALSYTNALQDYHAKRGAHGQLSPTEILETDGQVTIAPPPGAPPGAIGAMGISRAYFLYASPEAAGGLQTIDQRSDLYSLGVILYEKFTGRPPFPNDDLLRLVHCHMAVPVTPPQEQDPRIPKVMSDLVVKLLEKSPSARYASCTGLLHDLENCQALLMDGNEIDMFELGTVDRESQFLIPDRLYGREVEIATLDNTFDRAMRGEIILAMVAGYSGIGKSALVRAMRKRIVESGGRLIEGKFDQYHREMPYSALIEAFKSLTKQVLASTKQEIKYWRKEVDTLLGENASIVIDVVPEIERLIGPKPPAPELSDSAAQQRFNYVFSELLKLFASEAHPLVLFLDDLQWVDFASLGLIRTFVRLGVGAHLLMVGAYRDNEVDMDHPLAMTLKDLRAENAPLYEMTLGPLKIAHIAELIKDTCAGIKDPQGLAELVVRKTDGNPFFVRQFLKSMVTEETLYFDKTVTAWRWNYDNIRLQDAADNVVDLMMQRLDLLPMQCRVALKTAACIGKHFSLSLLARVSGHEMNETLTALASALQDELIMPTTVDHGTMLFQFVHDRVQQAAYTQKIEPHRKNLHYEIGNMIWRHTTEEDLDREVFPIVDQINLALELIPDRDTSLKVADLNHRAGLRARGSLAYAAAENYLRTGISLLADDDPWQNIYQLSYEMHLELAQIYSLLNKEEAFQKTIDTLLEHIHDGNDRLAVRISQTAHFCLSSRLFEGLDIGRIGLGEVGIAIPLLDDKAALTEAFEQSLAEFRERTANIDVPETVFNLDIATDALSENILRLIGAMADAATITNTPLLSLLSVIGAHRSLSYGNTLLSPLIYTLLGQGIIAHTRAYLEGRDMALVASKLSDEKLLDLWSYGRSRVHQFWFILHWSRHIEISLPEIEDAIAVTRRAHDPLYTAYLLNISVITQYFLGRSTADVLTAHERVVDHCKPYSMEVIIGFTQAYAGAAAALRGETDSLTSITGDHVDEDVFVEQFHDKPMIMGLFLGARTPLFGYDGQWERILPIADDINLKNSPPFMPHSVIRFWEAVAAARLTKRAKPAARDLIRDRFQAAYDFLETIHDTASADNLAHRIFFLKAEKARRDGEHTKVSALYSRAAKHAETAGYLLEHGYFLETQADWLHEIGDDPEHIQDLLHHAQEVYQAAQAHVLSQRINEKITAAQAPNIVLDDVEGLDVVDTLAILRAVQAINRHVDLNSLLNQLLAIIQEFSGAQCGAIVKIEHGHLGIERAWGISNLDELPRTLVRYVLNTGDTTALSDPGRISESETANDFSRDPYFERQRPAAVCCQPLGRRKNIRRVLYLEHGSITNLFSKKRLQVLELLCAQASISLENAELYSNLEVQVQERTSELKDLNSRLKRQQGNLRRARDAAEHAARAKAQFLANMSHEIRTPMNTILGMSNLALDLELAPKAKYYISKVHLSANHLLNIINDILDYSKIDSGNLRIDAVEFDLEDIFEQITTLIGFKVFEKGLNLRYDVADTLPTRLIGDPLRLKQILINLLGNAIKFTETGYIIVGVRQREVPSHDVELEFWVRDTGIGLPADVGDRLFKFFSQADDSVTRQYGGTGLGLAISKKLVEAMKGRIWAETPANGGACFRFNVHLNPAQPHKIQITHKNQRVLVVDNDTFTRDEVHQYCAHVGFEVDDANNLDAALTMLDEATAAGTPYDLVIVERDLPGMAEKGTLLAEKCPKGILLRRYGVAPADQQQRERVYPKQVTKPLLPHALIAAVDTVLKPHKDASTEHKPNDWRHSKFVQELQGTRVLVVEDNELNSDVLLNFFALVGIECRVAENGQVALDILAEDDGFDCILMDLQMPVMDGYTATRRIRENAAWDRIPIIGLTGNVMYASNADGGDIQMESLLTKPFQFKILLETIGKFVRSKSGRVSSNY